MSWLKWLLYIFLFCILFWLHHKAHSPFMVTPEVQGKHPISIKPANVLSVILSLGHMSFPQPIRCDIPIGHFRITCQFLELKMGQTTLSQRHGLRVVGGLLTKENVDGLNNRLTKTFVSSMLSFSWLDLPEALPEWKIVRLFFSSQPFASKACVDPS